MKVLFVASGNKPCGSGVVVANQAKTLKSSNIEVEFFLIKGKGFSGYIRNIFLLKKYICQNPNIDVIHSHYSFSAFVSTISIFLANYKIPHVVSLMGSDIKISKFHTNLIRICSEFFWDSTIVKSNSMRLELDLKKAFIIPNGVDMTEISRIERVNNISNNRRNGKSVFTVLFIADPSRREKNYQLAKEAIKLLDNRLILRSVYNVEHSVVIKELLSGDILLLTSLWEGSPNVVKEAMACNCSVVATNVGDISWLFGNESGHFLTTFEPVDVAAKIKQALEFSENQGRTNGRKRILELELDSESIARRLAEVYEEVNNKTRFSGKQRTR